MNDRDREVREIPRRQRALLYLSSRLDKAKKAGDDIELGRLRDVIAEGHFDELISHL